MVGAAYISCCYGDYKEEQLMELEETILQFHLPIRLNSPEFSPEDVLMATKLDKKMESGKIKFVSVISPGQSYVTKEFSKEQILSGIKYLFQQ